MTIRQNSHDKESAFNAILVNDNAIQLLILTELLHKQGLQVQAFNSVEATLLAMDSEVQPDLIVTDIHMPDSDGWRTFCQTSTGTVER